MNAERIPETTRFELQKYGHLTVYLSGLTESDFQTTFNQFDEVLDIAYSPDGSGQAILAALKYSFGERPEDSDYGLKRTYSRINQEGSPMASIPAQDIAHFGPLTPSMFTRKQQSKPPAAVRHFFNSCMDIYAISRQGLTETLDNLGLSEPLLAADRAQEVHILRLIRNMGLSACYRSDLHFDRSVVTASLYQSQPGLIGAPANNAYLSRLSVEELDHMAIKARMTDLPPRTGMAKVFLGAGYNHLPSAFRVDGLPLLLHGTLNEQPAQRRDAVVLFLNPVRRFRPYNVPSTESETSFEAVRRFVLEEDAGGRTQT